MSHVAHRLALALILSLAMAGCATPAVPSEEPERDTESAGESSESVQEVVKGEQLIVGNLVVPWDIAFLPSGDLLVTERPGRLVRIGEGRRVYEIEGVLHRGEGGLLGVALHPDFEDNRWLYLYLTTQGENGTVNRVERYRYADDALTDRTDILTGIPGALYHDGGQIAFGPDGFLYVTTGDAGNPDAAQNVDSLAGKILRLRDDGSVPDENPFGNAVYSYGHRNPQGLAWDDGGRLWSTEHGRSGLSSGYDELNLIEAGGNYGWPVIQGDETRDGMIAPVMHSGPRTTWAPASAAYARGSIFFGGLRGETLYEAVLSGDGVAELRTHLAGEYGRLRAIVTDPDGMLFLTTSNTDGRGSPDGTDDRVLRLDPSRLERAE